MQGPFIRRALTIGLAAAIAIACSVSLSDAAVAGTPSVSTVTPVVPSAVSAKQAAASFEPALIISDDNFYNFQSMTRAGVQDFLNNQTCVPRDDSPCLANYQQATRTVPRSAGHCERYAGRLAESAASIIWRVAQACKVSPRVLLVLVQKEQSLITHPSASGYERATGYGCPDTAPCNARYFGFFNQVYKAAWQFREYTLHPDEWRYTIGRVAIQFSPTLACGSRVVDIANQATANLYNYTPYQPNAATIAHPKGPSDACSAYGNLNFFTLFDQWFGSPTSVTFANWFPPCLNFVGGADCPVPKPFLGLR